MKPALVIIGIVVVGTIIYQATRTKEEETKSSACGACGK
jgi:hypothetical protein